MHFLVNQIYDCQWHIEAIYSVIISSCLMAVDSFFFSWYRSSVGSQHLVYSTSLYVPA